MDSHPKQEKEDPKEAAGKATYSTPRLVEYGSVAKLTQSAGITVEGGTGMMCL